MTSSMVAPSTPHTRSAWPDSARPIADVKPPDIQVLLLVKQWRKPTVAAPSVPVPATHLPMVCTFSFVTSGSAGNSDR
jgi:hypothetical protein